MKTDNHIQGRYLADVTKEVITDLESSKYSMVEWRISIYGRSMAEWDKLAAWVVDNKLYSHNVRWLIQVPRLYNVYKAREGMANFQQIIVNLFQPLFEVTKDPSSHPKLHIFLQRVIGLDTVDDESRAEEKNFRKFPRARDWEFPEEPPYSYWLYYLFTNIASLNVARKQRGFNTFLLRPHCGEAGDPNHLAAAILCCHSISHGVLLRKIPMLQYVFYLEQIGIAMSPLSNNALFISYDRNPFLSYFKRGLNVSISTDDPLQFAFTKEPLMEEYSVAAHVLRLSSVDMCELAKNSVLQSGFEQDLKKRWLGPKCHLPGVAGNDATKSNVPDIREGFRHETLLAELAMIDRYKVPKPDTQQVPSSNPVPPNGRMSQLSPTHSSSAAMMTSTSTAEPLEKDQSQSIIFPELPGAALPPDMTGVRPIRSQPSVHFDQDPLSSPPAGASSLQSVRTWPAAVTEVGGVSPVVSGTSSFSMDGSEPRLVPGMISHAARSRRRSSVAGLTIRASNSTIGSTVDQVPE